MAFIFPISGNLFNFYTVYHSLQENQRVNENNDGLNYFPASLTQMLFSCLPHETFSSRTAMTVFSIRSYRIDLHAIESMSLLIHG